jgi:probable HAF family extracellular repeat protein
MKRTRGVQLAAVLMLAVVVATSCRVVPDPLEDIGTLGGPYAAAYAVNDRGAIVGVSSSSEPPSGTPEAFLLDPETGAMTGLGVLDEGAASVAVDVNNSDVAVGTAGVWSSTIGELDHAVAFQPGTGIVDLNDSLGIWHESGATAVNDDGIVVGWTIRYFSLDLPFVVAEMDFAYDLDTGVVTPLPFRAADISDTGLVVGRSGDHAASYDLATATETDLGTLGGALSQAEAVNDSGIVVGGSTTSGDEFHAFRYDPVSDTMTDLDALDGYQSTAYGVNDSGNVVGRSFVSGGGQRGFFYWPTNRSMTDLGPLGTANYLGATDINNSNLVVGFADGGYTRAWRTTVQFLPHEDP